MKFDKLEVGMTLYSVMSVKCGNTTMKTLALYRSTVKEVDKEKRRALISWNGNPAQWRHEFEIEKLKDKKPILIATRMGMRRPTREELKEIRAKAKGESHAEKSERA